MIRRSARAVVVGLAVAGLFAAVSIPAGAHTRASVPAAQQGVTKDAIEIILVIPDIDALKAKGISSNSTNESFATKFTAYVDAFGPINGRKVNVKTIG